MGSPWLKAEGAIHLEGSERIGPEKILKNGTLEICDLDVITLQDMVTLWSKNVVRNCIFSMPPPAPPQLRGPCTLSFITYTCSEYHRKKRIAPPGLENIRQRRSQEIFHKITRRKYCCISQEIVLFIINFRFSFDTLKDIVKVMFPVIY